MNSFPPVVSKFVACVIYVLRFVLLAIELTR
jgi:hypothetical protein